MRERKSIRLAVCLILSSLLINVSLLFHGCGKGAADASNVEAAGFDPAAVSLSDPRLLMGKSIWVKTCTECHMDGLGGAPIIADKKAWKSRISKGKETLYKNAINGFIGKLMDEMPPKGGYDELSDDEVKAAVDFMIHVSK